MSPAQLLLGFAAGFFAGGFPLVGPLFVEPHWAAWLYATMSGVVGAALVAIMVATT